jgi:hypothetical protein
MRPEKYFGSIASEATADDVDGLLALLAELLHFLRSMTTYCSFACPSRRRSVLGDVAVLGAHLL